MSCGADDHASNNMDEVQLNRPTVPSNEEAPKRAFLGALQNCGDIVEPSTIIRPAIKDIDAKDGGRLVLVSEYANDIYDHLYKLEAEQPIRNNHLAGHREIDHKMRAILIDSISQMHWGFQFKAETFQLTVAIIDRYLQAVQNTERDKLQLVGVTALIIAAKYEETVQKNINHFVSITDETYSASEIRAMELQILRAIDYNLSRPLPIDFLRRFTKAAGAQREHHIMSKYFVELASVDYDLASRKPSEIAAAALFLSLHLLNGNHLAGTGFNDQRWTPTLAHYSRYTAAHLRPITRQIAKLAREAPQAELQALHKKHQGLQFFEIANRPELSGPLINSIVGQNN
ncbi:G2/mitotic-specific cyclin-B-like [Drosophila miranda]|uniref:G2/mitotic-specific cyclin-B-like n=1 Tax=Drosophila miranda TaxID=7229 RepID=UPI00143F529E|nr:G2/mitotic-specific cyclin-B-like [Drosophila miranda]